MRPLKGNGFENAFKNQNEEEKVAKVQLLHHTLFLNSQGWDANH